MLIMMCCRRFSVTCTSGSRSQRVVAPDCQIARREHFHHRRPGAAEAVRSLADSPAGRHPPEGLAVAPARELAARLHLHEAVRWQRLAEGDERLEDGDALAKPFRGVREPSRRPGSSVCSGAQAWMQHSAGTCPNSWRDGFARDCPLRHPVPAMLALRDRAGAAPGFSEDFRRFQWNSGKMSEKMTPLGQGGSRNAGDRLASRVSWSGC